MLFLSYAKIGSLLLPLLIPSQDFTDTSASSWLSFISSLFKRMNFFSGSPGNDVFFSHMFAQNLLVWDGIFSTGMSGFLSEMHF